MEKGLENGHPRGKVYIIVLVRRRFTPGGLGKLGGLISETGGSASLVKLKFRSYFIQNREAKD